MQKNHIASNKAKQMIISNSSKAEKGESVSSKTRILIVIDGLGRGGMERRMLELLKALKNRGGYEVEVFVLSEKMGYREIFDLGFNIKMYKRKIKKDPMVFVEIYKICRSFKPDIIHSWGIMSGVYVIPTSKLLGIPFINGNIRDATKRSKYFNRDRRRIRFSFWFSDVVVGNSLAGLRAFNAPKKKSVCIPNGIDLSRTDELIPENDIRMQYGIKTPKVVGMVGGFNYRKDYESFFKTAQIIIDKKADVTFVALGKGPDFEPMKASIPENYREKILLLGQLNDVESVINVLDVGVLATNSRNHEEGISNAILEYMLMAKPVVATFGGGTPEVVVDNETGFLVPPLRPDLLAEKIEFLLDNPSIRTQLGTAGKERIKNHFSLQIMEERYIQLYKSILNKKQ